MRRKAVFFEALAALGLWHEAVGVPGSALDDLGRRVGWDVKGFRLRFGAKS